MALARVKTWNAAETLTASDLNAEFNNICNHFGALTNADIDSTASYVMGELVVGSGITSADGGQLHVHTATAGTIQASGDADEAVFENSGASGITILSGATSTGNIAFGDSGDADNGLLKYTHGSTPTLGVTVNATAVQSIAAAATTLAHDFEIYQDVNNADSAIKMGTSATEALFVEALNGGSNKTLEELRFTTKTASGTANHGKMSFYVDDVNIGNINDAGITLESGMIFAGNLTGNVTGNASGTAATVTGGTQAAITTCANLVTTGALNSGSITSGFGTINSGSSSITTTGVITGGTVEATTDTAAADNAAMGYTEVEGLILTGQGSTNDVTIKNDADGTVLEIATGGTDVEVTSGNLIIGTSGKGIDFSATADAGGMTSEVLDDYEEGTWTATITFGGNAVGVGYNAQTMFYTKIGNVVTISGILGLSSKGSSTGYATVWGLPFTVDSAAGAYAGTAGYFNNVSFADVPFQIIHVNSTRIALEELSNAGGRSDLTDGNFADNGEMIVNLTYRAA